MKRIFTLFVSLFFISSIGFAQTQASGINFQSSGNGVNTSLKINWTSGTSTAGRIVIVKNSLGTFTPPAGNISALGASANFTAAGNDLDPSTGGIAKAVYAAAGAGTTVTVTNLTAGALYYVQVYEFTGSAASPTYLLTTNATNPLGVTFYTTDDNFIVPIGVTTVTVRAWGAGAGGGNGGGSAGSGGGGGSYASGTASVSFGVNPAIVVGSGGGGGGSNTNGSPGGESNFAGTTVVAPGGSVNNSQAASSGGVAGTGNITTVAGGNGGAGSGSANTGGGGGGSSGSTGTVDNGNAQSGGTGGAGGDGTDGDGGKGGNNGGSGGTAAQPGTFPGGGGGGRGDSGGNGASGADGLVIVSFKDNTAPSIASITRQSTNPTTGSSSVTFRVTLNEDVSNVDHTDFTIAGGGASGSPASFSVITPNRVFDIVVNSISGNGALNLDVIGGHNIVDLSNNAFGGTVTTEETYTIDNAGPIVTGVTSSAANATYVIGQTVDIIVAFNENAIVTGTPRVTLETGTVDRSVDYSSGSGTNTWTFTYTVQAGDVSGDLDYTTAAVLDLNSGAIKDALGNDATLTLAAPGAAGSISDNQTIVIDGVQPTVTNVTSAKPDATYTTGEVINITVTFSSAVTVTGIPQLTLETGGTDQVINYTGGTTTNTLTFAYTVAAGNNSADLDYASTSALALNGGTIQSAAGNNAVLTLASPGAAGSLGANKDLVIDTQAPSQPAAPDMTVGTDLGISSTDNITSDNTPDFSGTGTDGNTIKLFSSVDGQVGSMVVSGGVYSITATTLAGTTGTAHNMTVTETDPVGNASTASSALAITIDTSSPAAFNSNTFTTTGGIILASKWNASNTGISVVIPVASDASLTNGTIQLQGRKNAVAFANVGSAYTILVGDLGGNKTMTLTDTQFEAISTGIADGDVVEIRAVITDVSGNPSTIASNSHTLTVDQSVPAAFSTNTFTPTGGTVVAAYWNSTNTGISVVIPVASDATLTNGTIQLQGRKNAVAFANVGAAYTILVGDLGANKTMTLNDTQFEAISAGIADGDVVEIRAVITKDTGNPTTASNSHTLTVDQTVPVSFSSTTFTTTGGTVVPAFWNSTNTGISVVIPVAGDATLTNGTIQLQGRKNAVAFANVGAAYTILVGDLGGNKTMTLTDTQFEAISAGIADGDVVQIRAVITDATGNPSTTASNSHSLTVDQTVPTTFNSTTFTTTGGTVVPAFWNSTNTGISVVIPVAGDATLTNGTIQLQGRKNAVAFANVGAAYTILVGDLGGNKTMTLTDTQFEAISAGIVDVDVVEVRAIITDAPGNGSIASNSHSLTVDQTLPTFPTATMASVSTPNTAYAKVNDQVRVTFSTSETASLPTALIGGQAATVANLGSNNYTATVTTDNTNYAEGALSFQLNVQDLAGNSAVARTTVSSGSAVIFDKTPPVVASIARTSTLKGIGSTNGIVATSVDFLVTFTETNIPLSGIDVNGADFTVVSDGNVTYGAKAVSGSGTTRTVTISGIAGTGRISLGLTDDNTILDATSNPLAGASDGSLAASYTGNQYYTIVLPEPFIDATFSMTAPTITSNAITVNWVPNATAQTPTHYLVIASTGTPTAPVDGTPVADDANASDGVAVQNIPFGTNSAIFTSLNSGTVYNFAVYKYTLSANNTPDNIDYELTEPAILNGTETTTAALSKIVLNTAPVSIASIKNDNTNSGDVMKFTISDDNWTPIVSDVITLHLNGVSQETITFNIGDVLTLAEGANVTGFFSSTGSVANAIYSGKGTTNTITLTNAGNGTWTSGTTIGYSAGNVQLQTTGALQNFSGHAVVQATDVVQVISSDGTFVVPPGVTKVQVEAWGGGGSAGGSFRSALVNSGFAIAPGTWTLQLYDAVFGFEGGLVDVYVNGSLLINDAGSTLTSSGQTQNFTFSVPTGATIFVDYSAGSFSYENTMRLYDASSNLLREWFGNSSPNDFSLLATSPGGAGAGGGAYSRSLLTVTPNDSYNVVVGTGGAGVPAATNINGNAGGQSTFGGTLVTALGGNGGSASNTSVAASGGLGGQAAAGTGDVKFSGGNGGSGSTAGSGGGGGSSAGTNSNGNPGSSGTSGADNGLFFASFGAVVTGGGRGGYGFNYGYVDPGIGGLDPASYIYGLSPGGGGGGVSGAVAGSGIGANGQVRITYSLPASTDAGDNAPFKFSDLVITQGAGNDITDWRTIIGGAELFDGANTRAGTVNATDGSTIIFSNIPASNATTDVGFITDASTGPSSKTYTLKIWLKPNLTNSLAADVDGKNLAFTVSPANLIYNDVSNGNTKSSRLIPGHPALSSGAKEITVAATKLEYHAPGSTSPVVTQPQPQIGVGTPFSSSSVQQPRVYALDANNNLDLNYINDVDVTNPTFQPLSISKTFAGGVLSLSDFVFTTGSPVAAPVNTQIKVEDPDDPTNLTVTSTNVAPVISGATTISAGPGGPAIEPLIVSSLRTSLSTAILPQLNAVSNFDFTISDDVGADASSFFNNDALPTTFNQIVITQGAGTDAVLQGQWDKVIAGAELTLTSTTGSQTGLPLTVSTPANVTVGTNSITFGSIAFAAGSPGRVDDGRVNTYTLKIYFHRPVNPTLQDFIDKNGFEFVVTAGSFQPAGGSNATSVITTSTATSGALNNRIEVTATRLDFTTQWPAPSPTPFNQDYDAPLNPTSLQAKARDVNQNLDIDWNIANGKSGSVLTTNPALYPLANTTVALNNGVFDFDDALQVTSANGGLQGGITNLVLSSTGLTNGSTNTFTLNYSANSDITRESADFTYPVNIDYAASNNQLADISSTTGVALERFKVRDGGGTNDLDGTSTKLTSVTIRVTNYQHLKRLELYERGPGPGYALNNMIAETSTIGNIVTAGTAPYFSGSTADYTFSGITNFQALDAAENNFELRASFNSGNIKDNDVITFQIVSVGTSPFSSKFANLTPPAIASSVSGDQNKIEVTATQLDITSPASASDASLNSDFSGVVVEARDANANRDLDFNGIITALTNPLNRTMINGPTTGTSAFSSGLYPFATDFQFTSGANGDNVTLTIKADNTGGNSGTDCTVGTGNALCSGISPTITLQTSFESSLLLDPTFTVPSRILYLPYQEASNIQNTGTSYELTRMLLVDGSRGPGYIYNNGVTTAPLNTNTNSGDALPNADADGAGTVLTDLTVRVYKPSTIRRIALYANGIEVSGTEIDVAGTLGGAINSGTAFYDFTWTSTNLATATNDSQIPVSVRVSFRNTSPDLDDGDDIQVQLLSATVGTGSQFFLGVGLIGGQPSVPASSFGLIDVVATSLDFVNGSLTGQPSTYAGVNEPVGQSYTTAPAPSTTAGIVSARDSFANVDTGFTPTSITLKDALDNVLIQPSGLGFINGVMNLDGMQYPVAVGDKGAVTVTTTGPTYENISSPTVSSGNAIASEVVNVLDVSVTIDTNNGVVAGSGSPPQAPLKGGLQNVNIFGLKFTANAAVGAEPKLKGFTVSFKSGTNSPAPNNWFENTNSGTVVLSGFNVFMNGTSNNVTSIGGVVSKVSSGSNGLFDQIFVDLSSVPQTLSSGPLTFYLIANVDASTNTSTQTLIPYFIDAGYGTASDKNTIVSNGTTTGNFDGNEYSFASTQPPTLKADLKKYPGTNTRPYTGQPNVDPALSKIVLEFDTNVGVLDDLSSNEYTGELWSRFSNTKVADLKLNTIVPVAPLAAPTTPAAQGTVSSQTVANIYPKLVFDIVNKSIPTLAYDEVYFVKIRQGSYDPTTNEGHGITDYGLNFFGGIKDNSTLYFKVSSNSPIKLSSALSTFNRTTLGTLTTSFDQLGTAYYLIVKAGDPAPTVSEITGVTNYATAHPTATIAAPTNYGIGSPGNYPITAVNVDQTYTFAANFVSGTNYHAYVFAKNDAQPTPVAAAGIYGAGPTFTPSTTPVAPTLIISGIPSGQPIRTPNNPSNNLIFTICPDSPVTITQPMIIGEQTNNSFFSAGFVQDFNILLPTGYEFDVTIAPKIQLIGNDFLPHGAPTFTYSYTSNTLLNVKFSNSGSTSTDYIAVSGLSIIGAAGSSQGNIQWFYGNNVFTPTATPFFTLAQITMGAALIVPDFTNTFWYNNQQVAPFTATNPSANIAFQKTVNAIPDNYVDPNNAGAVRLLPSAPPYLSPSTFASGDYLASFFSGTGVSGDLLTLNAVQAGAAFNISMLHSDLNGCTTTKKQQYVVYDHNSPISKKLGVTLNITTPVSPAGTKQDLVNTNFPTGVASPITPTQTVLYNELAGYSLMELKADLPASEIALNSLPTPSKSQIISGTAWRNLVQTQLLNPPITVPGSGNINYHDYTWDYNKVLNATTPLPSGQANVYDYFKSGGTSIPLSPNGNNYWTGGSLGKVEYTGVYQSTADNSVYVPFRQAVELFMPAVPLIEVTSPKPTYDKLDAATTPNFNAVQYPATNTTSGYPGTSIFCEFGGTITLTGYPQATGGISNGTFAIYDYQNYSIKGTLRSGTITTVTSSTLVVGVGTQFNTDTKVGAILYTTSGTLIGKVVSIADNEHLTIQSLAAVAITNGNYKSVTPLVPPAPSSAFIDNGNGTMTMDPTNTSVRNAYKDVIVTYTYQDNNSPAIGTGYLVLRITPNPVAKFVQASDLTAGSLSLGRASSADAYCAAIPIIFDPTSSTIAADNIASYDWNFGRSASDVASSTVIKPTITNGYSTIGTYRATLTVTSDKGCSSINTDNFADVTVGSIPTFSSVAFDLAGISTATPIIFTDRTTAASNGTNSFSKISNVAWDYGDGIVNATGSHQYTTPDHYDVKATVTTAIGASINTMNQAGCVRSFDRHIVILDKKTGFYEDDFESSTSKWQTIRDSTAVGSNEDVNSSWKRGTPAASRAYIKSTPVSLAATNNNVWATGLTGTYVKDERSFLYSPAIDMTGFTRPMISFDANWALGKDGAVLEYSTDNLNVADPNKVWKTVGNNATGVKWFTDQNISSKPGKQENGNFGWSGSSTTDKIPTGWVESKHELSGAISDATTLRTNVVFRFSFATLGDGSSNVAGTGTDGFAIDNFRVGERTRTILLEKFTSTNGMDAAQNNNIASENDFVTNKFQIDALNATTVVRLNYHIGFTRPDPFNTDNPADPSARALYYNINDVPRVFLDGIRPAAALLNAKFDTWGVNEYNSQTLKLGQANIDVQNITTNADGSIKFNVEVTALSDLPANTVVHVAMIERSVVASAAQLANIKTGETTFDYVLKKMLPNALGTKLGTPLAKNQKRPFNGFEYYPDPVKLYNNNSDLAVIVFLQNEETKEVYQTFMTSQKIDDPKTVTGIEEPAISLEAIALFPNPADNEFTVQLPSASKTETRLRLADQVGKIVYDSFIPAGSTEKKINTADMASGMYFLQVDAANNTMTRKKVMVVHNK